MLNSFNDCKKKPTVLNWKQAFGAKVAMVAVELLDKLDAHVGVELASIASAGVTSFEGGIILR
jgi:hypothetical protein